MKKLNKKKPIIGFSIGDINGIGPEILIKSLSNHNLTKLFTPLVYCNFEIIDFYSKILKKKLVYEKIDSLNKIKPNKINLIPISNNRININPGKIKKEAGIYSFKSLELSTNDLIKKKIDGIVTLPINKKNIQSEKFKFPGHSEYFAKKTNSKDFLMMMVSEKLKVGVLTGHIPFKFISKKLSKLELIKKINILMNSLKNNFKINNPKIGILSLNPHAGEDGMLGNEEDKIIKPVIKKLNHKNKNVYGPFSSDSYFGNKLYKKYDATFSLYHDQGLIPFKMISFSDGVNFTAGLKFIRTSPDHGTAYDISGKNQANNISLDKAILLNLKIIAKNG